MPTPIKIFVVTVEDISNVTGSTGLTNTMINSLQQQNQSFTLVSNTGQVIAGITNLVPVLAPIRIETNTFAAATVFLKMEADLADGKSLDPGDEVSLVGSVAGVVAAVAILAAAPEVAVIATAVAVAADLAGLFVSAEQASLGAWANSWASDNLSGTPVVPMDGLYLTSDNQLMTPAEIQASGKQYGGLVVTPSTGSTTLAPAQPIAELPAGDQSGGGNPSDSDDWGDGDDDLGDDDSDDQGMTTQG